jgi:outer membrane autotransporter protein
VITNTGSITTNGTNATAVFAQGTNNRLSNSGTIHVTGSGADAVFMDTVGTSNTATVENLPGGRIISDQGDALRTLSGTTTVINAGLIQSSGAAFNGGNAVAGSSLTFILQTGSQIIGTANGAPNASNELRLQGSGVVDNAFTSFQTLTMEGTDWTWRGTGDFTNTFVNSGTLRLQTPLTGNVAVAAPATLEASAQTLTGNVANDGLVRFAQPTDGTYAGVISGTGAVEKTGAGTLTLTGANTYTGGTTVNAGTLQLGAGGSLASTGSLTVNGGTFALNGHNQTVGMLSGSGGVIDLSGGTLTVNNNADATLATSLVGNGSFVNQGTGTLDLTGNNTFTGSLTTNSGGLAMNGSFTGTVIVNGGTLSGNGTMGGLIVNAGGTVAPGNSIGTLTVTGNMVQNAGSFYQVEANAAGQSDRINVGGTATLNGGTVQVLAQPGNYRARTTYTILRASGGVTGTYSGVTSNFAFLTPSLSYDANDVFLTLALAGFSFGGRTINQRAVGGVPDQTFASASGDYATVLNAIAALSREQGPQILDAISGQNYAGFSNAMVQAAQLFLTNFANRAGSSTGGGTKVQLAEACVTACDATPPAVWGAWGGAVGGTGTISGNDNAGTFTYTVGGFSGGLDRKFGDNFTAGVTVGYLTGGQWTGGFSGRSVTDSVQAGLYGSFLQGPLYVDAIAGYAYSSNQLWRNINIPGLQSRTAYGNAGANQFLGQLETGWRFDFGGAPGYYVTPFGLIQGSVVTQNALTETGAQSLGLNVAQQTTSSLRTIFGAQLGASMDVGLRDRIAAQLRLGWSHEYSDTARPVTASFVGAPAVPFTVFGAAPTRDGAVIGFSASTAVADAASVYVRYEGTIAGQDSGHALTAGLRMTW